MNDDGMNESWGGVMRSFSPEVPYIRPYLPTGTRIRQPKTGLKCTAESVDKVFISTWGCAFGGVRICSHARWVSVDDPGFCSCVPCTCDVCCAMLSPFACWFLTLWLGRRMWQLVRRGTAVCFIHDVLSDCFVLISSIRVDIELTYHVPFVINRNQYYSIVLFICCQQWY